MRPLSLLVLAACSHVAPPPRASAPPVVAASFALVVTGAPAPVPQRRLPPSREELARRVQALALTATDRATLPVLRPHLASYDVGDVSTSAGLSPTRARRILESAAQPLFDCYSTALREEDDAGPAHVEAWLGVDASGKTIYAEAMTATASRSLAMCVEGTLRHAEFPAADVPLRAIDASLYFRGRFIPDKKLSGRRRRLSS